MHKKDENGDFAQPDTVGNPGSENPPQENSAAHNEPTFRAVEEHAAALGVSAPVFAAVTQTQGWAAGKKVEKTAFEQAVKGFLNAPVYTPALLKPAPQKRRKEE
jgi:hypothetical protein